MNKEQIKIEIKTWLLEHGCPPKPPEFVIESLPQLFNMLLEKKLVTVDMERAFHNSANQIFMLHKMGAI